MPDTVGDSSPFVLDHLQQMELIDMLEVIALKLLEIQIK